MKETDNYNRYLFSKAKVIYHGTLVIIIMPIAWRSLQLATAFPVIWCSNFVLLIMAYRHIERRGESSPLREVAFNLMGVAEIRLGAMPPYIDGTSFGKERRIGSIDRLAS